MNSFVIQRWLHDSAAWYREWRGVPIRQAWLPDPAEGRAVVRVQEAGREIQDNRFAASLVPDEPTVTEWDWPTVDLWRLEKVRVVGTSGYVFLQGDVLWNPSALDARGRQGKVRPPLPWAQINLTSPCVHLCGMNAENRGHFMLEILPRLEALLSAHPEAGGFRYLVPAGHARWQALYLKKYGIDSSQLVEQGPGTTRVAELWMVPMLNGVDKLTSPQWHNRVAQRLSGDPPAAPPEGPALMVSRQKAPNKRIENEEALIALMKSVCGEVMVSELTGVPLEEQVAMFRRAPLIVGGYGQGLTNTLFTRDSSVLVLTSAPSFKKPSWVRAFQQLAQLTGNRAVCLLGSGKGTPNENYVVDEKAFAHLLAQVWERRKIF